MSPGELSELVLRIKSTDRRACGRVEARRQGAIVWLRCNCGRALCEHRLAVLRATTHRLADLNDAQALLVVADWLHRAGFDILLAEFDRCTRTVELLERRGACDERPLHEARERRAWARNQLAQSMQQGLSTKRLAPQQLGLIDWQTEEGGNRGS